MKGTVMRNVSRAKPRNQSSKAIVSNSNDRKTKEPQKGQPIQEYLRKWITVCNVTVLPVNAFHRSYI